MSKKYVVTLTEEEREQLRALVSTGKSAARKLNHARVLLLADRDVGMGHTDEEIVKALGLGARTVERVRQSFVEEGFEAALNPKPQPRRARKLEGQVEDDLIALAKSDPPKGRKRWTCGCWPTRCAIAVRRGCLARERAAGAKKMWVTASRTLILCVRDVQFTRRFAETRQGHNGSHYGPGNAFSILRNAAF